MKNRKGLDTVRNDFFNSGINCSCWRRRSSSLKVSPEEKQLLISWLSRPSNLEVIWRCCAVVSQGLLGAKIQRRAHLQG